MKAMLSLCEEGSNAPCGYTAVGGVGVDVGVIVVGVIVMFTYYCCYYCYWHYHYCNCCYFLKNYCFRFYLAVSSQGIYLNSHTHLTQSYTHRTSRYHTHTQTRTHTDIQIHTRAHKYTHTRCMKGSGSCSWAESTLFQFIETAATPPGDTPGYDPANTVYDPAYLAARCVQVCHWCVGMSVCVQTGSLSHPLGLKDAPWVYLTSHG